MSGYRLAVRGCERTGRFARFTESAKGGNSRGKRVDRMSVCATMKSHNEKINEVL